MAVNRPRRFLASAVAISISASHIAVFAAEEQKLTSSCAARLASLGESSPKLDPFRFRTVPEAAAAAAKASFQRTFVVLNHLPQSPEEFKRVFGKSASRADAADMKAAHAEDKFGKKLAAAQEASSNSFKMSVQAHSEEVILVVGHNDGNSFVFRDGSKMLVTDMVEACGAAKKLCVLISCKAKQFAKAGKAVGTAHVLSQREAIRIANRIGEGLGLEAGKAGAGPRKSADNSEAKSGSAGVGSNSGTTSAEQIAEDLSSAERSERAKVKFSYIVVNGCGALAGAVIVALLIELLCDDDDQTC